MSNLSVSNKSTFKKIASKSFVYALAIGLLVQFSGCGYVLYPERKGQVGGQIDPAVAILDGIGLLFFLVPGVVAFAVDFTNGTIYLPHGKKSRLSQQEIQSIKANGKLDQAKLNQLLSEKIGQSINIQADGVRVQAVASEGAVLALIENQSLSLVAR